MPRGIPKSKTKPTLLERQEKIAKREQAQRGRKIDPTRQRKTSRNGGALKRNKKVELNGAERYFIQGAIERMKVSERTTTEKTLLKKVR
jgi:hypothetical protein